jgi:hypothetical protein
LKQLFPLLITLMLLGISSTVQPQTATPLPEPEAIFAEGVKWSPIEPEIMSTARENFEKPVIEVFDGEVWQEFPYPPGVDEVYGVSQRADGIVVALNSREIPAPKDVWLLDPETGEYERPPGVCEERIIQAPTEKEGEWVVIRRNDVERLLCHSWTGEMRDVLPDKLESWSVFPSPDNDYLVLSAFDFRVSGDFQVFAYNLIDDEMLELGEAERGIDNTVEMCGWVSDTKGILCVQSIHAWSGTPYYTFNVTQPDSLINSFGGWDENIFRNENPPRYLSLDSQDYGASITGGRGAEHIPCSLTVYDAEQLFELEVGYECIPTLLDTFSHAPYVRQGNAIYYLTTASEDATVSTLYRYDAEALVATELFTGEIESVLSASPDGRFVVLLMDDNGLLDFPWEALAPMCCPEGTGHTLVIIDNQIRKLVYRSEPIGVYTAAEVVWLDNQTVVISSGHVLNTVRVDEEGGIIQFRLPASLRRITFNADASVNTVIDTSAYAPEFNTSPDNGYSIRTDNTVLDLTNFHPVPVLREGINDEFDVHMRWLEDGDLQVYISNSDNSARYRVELP